MRIRLWRPRVPSPRDLLTQEDYQRLRRETSEDMAAESAARGDQPGTELERRERFDLVDWNRRYVEKQLRAAEIARRNRTHNLPARVTAGTASIAGAGWVVDATAGASGHLISAAGGPAAAALTLAVMRLLHRDKLTDWSQTYKTTAAQQVAWVAATTALGPGWFSAGLMGATLLAGYLVKSGPWRRAHSAPLGQRLELETEQRPELEPPTVRQHPQVALRNMLVNRVCCRDGALAKADLQDPEDLGHAYRWTVRFAQGDYYRGVVGPETVDAIAGALEMPAGKVLIERHPGGEHLARLTIVVKDLLAAGIPWVEPTYNDGRILIAQFPDLSWGHFLGKDRIGVKCGAITGDPGTGKSGIAARIVRALRASGEWKVLFTDGDPGAGSSSDLVEQADWPAAGAREGLRQLEAMEAAGRIRSAVKATLTKDPATGLLVPITQPGIQRPAAGILPQPGWPGHMLVIDEAGRVARELEQYRYAERVKELIEAYRKYGLAVLWITHSLLIEGFGDLSTLLGLLHRDNSFACRAQNEQEYLEIDGMLIRPSELPNTGGYLYSLHSGSTTALRAPNPDDAPSGAVLLRPSIPADRPTGLAMAPYWPREPRDAVTAYREAVERSSQALAALARGETTAQDPAYGDNVYQFPEQEDDGGGIELSDNAGAVLTAMQTPDKEGALPTRNYQLIQITGLSGSAVSKALNELKDHDLVRKQRDKDDQPKHGHWGLTELGQEVSVA